MNNTPDLRRDVLRLLLASLFFGATSGIFQSTLNNYLAEVHSFDATSRGWLELPREMPGFLLFFIASAMLMRMREGRMATAAMILSGVGAIGLGCLAPGTLSLVAWIFVWSLGDHILFAVEGPLGLKLADRGAEGRRLGQLGGARNLGTIIGVGLVFLLARLVGNEYRYFYLAGGLFAFVSAWFFYRLKVGSGEKRPPRRLIVRRRYSLFYAISALFGIRKQIFLVFGSWVLVSIHGTPVATIALLYFIAATLGVIMRPLLGDVIDWLGERKVLAADELIFLVICLTYAFAADLLAAPWALYTLYAAYVLDSTLFALRVARTTYLKKIALDQADITPTVSLGITIDHSVAMSLPILSGYIWEAWGYRWVFLIAGLLATAGFFLCLRIRVPAGVPSLPGGLQRKEVDL